MFMKAIKLVGQFLTREAKNIIEELLRALLVCLFLSSFMIVVLVPLFAVRYWAGVNVTRPFVEAIFWPWMVGGFASAIATQQSERFQAFVVRWVRRFYYPIWKILEFLVLRPLAVLVFMCLHKSIDEVCTTAVPIALAAGFSLLLYKAGRIEWKDTGSTWLFSMPVFLCFGHALHVTVRASIANFLEPSQSVLRGRREEG